MKNTDMLFDEPSASQPEKEREWSGPRHLTSSQAKALNRLADLARLRGQPDRSGITLRNKPLLLGPSGSGKTALVRRLCDLEQLPLLIVNGGGWIPYGASNGPHTLTLIRRFVENNAGGGIIFVDEIDKSCPTGASTFNHSWALGVFSEILTLLDGDSKLSTAAWRQEHVQCLGSFFIIGAGAWQSHASATRRNGAQREQGYADKVVEQAGIPEEILYRFNATLLEIGLPSRKDFAQAVRRVHTELGVPPLSAADEEKALDAAIRSNCGMRWVEEYLAELLIRVPQATAKPVKTKATASDKISITRTEFNQRMASALEAMESTRRSAKGLEVKLRLALQIARSTTPDLQKNFLDPEQIKGLIEALEKARSGLRYGTSVSQKQRLLRETEFQVHGTDLLSLLDNWFMNRAFAMKSCSLLDPALDLYASFERILFTWQHLAAVEVLD